MGIILFSSNHSERLADQLAESLAADARAPDALRAQHVAVAYPGMTAWLTRELAAKLGVCANIRFPSVRDHAWSLAAILQKKPGLAPIAPKTLRWRIFRLLRQGAITRVNAEVRELLQDASDQKRWRLAESLAGLYADYAVHRPEWLHDWENGVEERAPTRQWQAALWRDIVAADNAYRDASLLPAIEQLREKKSDDHALPKRIFLFGISQMPALYWRFFAALADIVEVSIFYFAPCLQWWADMRPEKALQREFPALGPFRSEHALLEQWGAPGREFQALLYADEDPRQIDAWRAPEGVGLLPALQNSILHADASMLEGVAEARGDSVAIHACHDPLREVEVLHDALLRCFNADPRLLPQDVGVLCVDIARYAPLIAAVFDAQPVHAIPYRVQETDGPRRLALATFVELLKLPDSRFTLTEALAWLDNPWVRACFGLDEEEARTFSEGLMRAGVRWGIDGDFRSASGSYPTEQGTWAEGISRLVLGYATGEGDSGAMDMLAVDYIEGEAAESLGKGARLLGFLMQAHRDLRQSRTLASWMTHLEWCFDALLLPEHGLADAAVSAARFIVRDALEALRAQAWPDAPGESLDHALVRGIVLRELEEASPMAAAPGVVSIGSIDALRQVPFKIVAVLGLNEGDFPRRAPPPGFDLMAASPRRGDFRRHESDRYLFLETLMSARNHLHLSYVGYDRREGKSLPPSSCLQQLAYFLVQCAYGGERHRFEEAVWFYHPPQPFSEEEFHGARLPRSFAAHWLPSPQASAPFPFADGARGTREPKLTMDDLRRFIKDPAAAWLKSQGLLQYQQPEPIDEDPLALPAYERFAARLALLHAGTSGTDERYALRAAGMLPDGALGETILRATREEVGRLGSLASAFGVDLHRPLAAQVCKTMIDGHQLQAELHLQAEQYVWLYPGRLSAQKLAWPWVLWLLAAAGGEGRPLLALGFDADQRAIAWRAERRENALDPLRAWVSLVLRGRSELIAWLPAASAELAERMRKGEPETEALAKTRASWQKAGAFGAAEREKTSVRIAWRDQDPFRHPEFVALAKSTYWPMFDDLASAKK